MRLTGGPGRAPLFMPDPVKPMPTTAAYIHSQYRSLISQPDFDALTGRPEVRMSRFQRAALWLCYEERRRCNHTASQLIRETMMATYSRCGDDQCPCRYGDACPKEDSGKHTLGQAPMATPERPYTAQTPVMRSTNQNAEHAVFCNAFELTKLGRFKLYIQAEQIADALNRAYADGFAAGQLDVKTRVERALQ